MFLKPSSDSTCCFLALQHLPVGSDKITEVAEGYPFHYHSHSSGNRQQATSFPVSWLQLKATVIPLHFPSKGNSGLRSVLLKD